MNEVCSPRKFGVHKIFAWLSGIQTPHFRVKSDEKSHEFARELGDS